MVATAKTPMTDEQTDVGMDGFRPYYPSFLDAKRPPVTRPRLDSAAVIQVIQTKHLQGDGEPHDLMREVTRYWTLDGTLLAEVDNFSGRRG